MITQVAQWIIFFFAMLGMAWMIVDQFFPDTRNLILGLWHLHISGQFNKPFPVALYENIERQLKNLEKTGKRKAEQRLMREILLKAGKIKAKLTGKNHNKLRWKLYRGGRKITNFR